MRLRELRVDDAQRMIEWMHDPFVVGKMNTDFSKKTIDDCIAFIATQDDENIHLAITDDDDKYMGTVSLKHITKETAEFAIAVRREAMGKGYSIWAMKKIIEKGFKEYHLNKIYWCVASDNVRALRFYDKNNFYRTEANKINIAGGYTQKQINSYVWYQVSSN